MLNATRSPTHRLAHAVLLAWICIWAGTGCGEPVESTGLAQQEPGQPPIVRRKAGSSSSRRDASGKSGDRKSTSPARSRDEQDPRQNASPADNAPTSALDMTAAPPLPPVPAPDMQRLATAGIRRLEGRHLILYTDIPAQAEVDELPQVFDAAVEPWCAYFGVPVKRLDGWRMTGYLMNRKERFQATGLLPEDLPPFLNGYQRGPELWVYEQPSAYYRRHLLLHEGTHAFMSTQLLGCGPPWYMEGMAELMGTHRWVDGRLQMAYFPQRRDEVEQWGRIKIVQDEVAAGRALTLESITEYGPTAHLKLEPYGWCWAAAAFLDGHPQFRERFRQLPRYVRDETQRFTTRFWALFADDRRAMIEQWQLFVTYLDYGYDLEREAVVYDPPGKTLLGPTEVEIQADRGWQSSGVRVEAGQTYQLEAKGRYQIGVEPRVWWCEPGGVTIDYYRGRPLGQLLAATTDPSQPLVGLTPLARPDVIGTGTEWTARESGTLFLRINDSPAGLRDNAGSLRVLIRPAR